MKHPASIVAIIILLISAFFMFEVKHKVQNLKRDLTQLNRQLASDRDAIYVLKAEWAYLTDPSRIRKLANIYLDDMQYASSSQVRFDQGLPYRLVEYRPEVTKVAVVPKLKPVLSNYRVASGREEAKPRKTRKSWWQF